MTWIVVLGLLAAITLLIMASRWFVNASAHDLAQAARAFVVTFTALLSSGLMFTGRFGFAIAALAATAYAVRAFRRGRRPPEPFGDIDDPDEDHDEATVRTRTLAMRLDPMTGSVDGDVLRGRFRGRRLTRLSLPDLLRLLDDCRRDDPESEPLVEAFLDRRHPDWRQGGQGDTAEPGGEPAMNDARALEILGLTPDAGEEDIKAAHRRLMAHVHPDRGGSTFLAAQLNAARAHLLDRLRRR